MANELELVSAAPIGSETADIYATPVARQTAAKNATNSITTNAKVAHDPWSYLAQVRGVPLSASPLERRVNAAVAVRDVMQTFHAESAAGDQRFIATAGKILSYGGSAVVVGSGLETAAAIVAAGAATPPALVAGGVVALASLAGGAYLQRYGADLAQRLWDQTQRLPRFISPR